MKKVLVAVALVLVSCQAAVLPMAQSQLKDYLDGGAPFDFILIDLRSGEEIEAVIGNAQCKPYNLAWPTVFTTESARIPKDRTIIVYCRTGGRATGAANYLIANGYTNVYNGGGILSWNGPVLPPSEIKPMEHLPAPSMHAARTLRPAAMRRRVLGRPCPERMAAAPQGPVLGWPDIPARAFIE